MPVYRLPVVVPARDEGQEFLGKVVIHLILFLTVMTSVVRWRWVVVRFDGRWHCVVFRVLCFVGVVVALLP